MSLAFNLLLLLIAAAPISLLIGASMASIFQIAIIAFATAAASLTSRQSDTNHLAFAARGLTIVIALPLLLVALQLVPLPLSLSHSIWSSAAEALPGMASGHLTIDIGRTVSALITTIALMALGATSIVVARDRRRAEMLILAAGAVITLLSLASIVKDIVPSLGMSVPRPIATAFAGVGLLLNFAAMILVFERRETRRLEAARYSPIGLGSTLAFLINAVELNHDGGMSQFVATGLGLGVMLLLIAIRRLNLSSWTVAGLCLATIVGIGILQRGCTV